MEVNGVVPNGTMVSMDANKSNSIYKDGVTEVTPPNMWLNYIIKL